MNMKYTRNDLNETVWAHPQWIKDNRDRWVVDATWMTLWRLAVEIAKKLQWKHKSYYCDMWDTWDYVVVTNVDKIVVTWNKLATKKYYRYSWYKWNVKSYTLKHMMNKHPERVLNLAVKWMLPKNKLRKNRLSRLKISLWDEHKYSDKNLKELIV